MNPTPGSASITLSPPVYLSLFRREECEGVPLPCLSACLSYCLSVCRSACPYVFLSVSMTVCLSVSMSFCRSACLSFSISVCLSLCLSVGLHVCLSDRQLLLKQNQTEVVMKNNLIGDKNTALVLITMATFLVKNSVYQF